MINLKICGIIAGAAFVISLLIGFITQSSMPSLIIRPAIFAAVFFVCSCIINFLVKTFVPELLEDDAVNDDPGILPGSRIDITEGDTPLDTNGYTQGARIPVAKPSFMDNNDSEEGLGDISNLLDKNGVPLGTGRRSQAGMDQNGQDEYTEIGDLEEVGETKPGDDETFAPFPAAASKGARGGKTADIPAMVDMLPDLDSMAGAFLPVDEDGETDTGEYSASTPSPQKPLGRKAPPWAGDFNAKDIAAGLRTVLSKDKEG